ncbi:MAG: hypothetical protein ACRDY2_09580, partial [Acidimicrobiales bacterium]
MLAAASPALPTPDPCAARAAPVVLLSGKATGCTEAAGRADPGVRGGAPLGASAPTASGAGLSLYGQLEASG